MAVLVVTLTWIVMWMWLILSKEPTRVGVTHPFFWEQKRNQFPKRRVLRNSRQWPKSKNWVIPNVMTYVTIIM
jgi:hypothetical protein